MSFKLIVLIFGVFYPLTVLCGSVPFPPEMRWTNSLDTPEKVKLFTASNTDFGRDIVYMKGEAEEEDVYMGKGDYKLMHCLREFNNSRMAHQIILVFENVETYKMALNKVLIIFKFDWFWVHFRIQLGPKSVTKPVDLSEFRNILPAMRKLRNQFSFGLTLSPNYSKLMGYTGQELAALANKTDDWYAALEYDRQFMVELSMYLVIMTKDRMIFLKPYVSRSMLINLEADRDFERFIVSNKGIIQTVAKSFGPERVYMNIPEEMRKGINPGKWKSKTKSWAPRIFIYPPCYLILLPFILSIAFNE